MRMKQNTIPIWLALLLMIFVIAGTSIVLKYNHNSDGSTEKDNKVFRAILLADVNSQQALDDATKANDYYNEASLAYEKNNFDLVESNCRLARGYYDDSNNEFLQTRAKLQNTGIEDKLIDLYSSYLTIYSEIELNLYEACEHFESAARYYDIYYNTDVPDDDSSYDMGTSEIDAMNDKIDEHDANVRQIKEIYSQYSAELEARLDAK